MNDTTGSAIDAAASYIRENLDDCVSEMIDWRKSGNLVDGKIRKAAELCRIGEDRGAIALQIAERLLLDATFDAYVRMKSE